MNRLMPFVFILLSIGLFFGYIKPAWQGSVAEHKSKIASYESALDAAASFKTKEAQLEQERDQIPQDQLDRLNAFLPDSVNNVQLILDLNALATRSGMSLSDFTTGNSINGAAADSSQSDNGSFAPSANPVDSLTLTVNAAGTYNAFRSFLAGVEQSLRPLDITSLTVDDSETGVYTYHITFTFYWLH